MQFLKANILILPLNVLRLDWCYDFKDTCEMIELIVLDQVW